VRALRGLHVLAVELPKVREVHHRIERALTAPGRARGMRALASKLEDRRDQRQRRLVAPRDPKLVADVREQVRVDILE